jgi:hypothetical protein
MNEAKAPRDTSLRVLADGSTYLLRCRDCPMWYGAEDEGWGPCQLKQQRADQRYLTYGGHECDEGYVPPEDVIPGNASRFNGSRSTSSASAVGYSSTTKAGARSRAATRRRRSGASSTRRRAASIR